MPKTLEALLKLQSVERQLVEVRRQLKAKGAALELQQKRLEELQGEYKALRQEHQTRQKDIGSFELDLKSRDEQVTKLRLMLNTAKTNKEYAAILTQINTIKADTSRQEEQALRLMQTADDVQRRAEEIKGQIQQTEEHLEEIRRTSAEDVAKLQAMQEGLEAKREAAADRVPRQHLSIFNRIAATREGEVMARSKWSATSRRTSTCAGAATWPSRPNTPTPCRPGMKSAFVIAAGGSFTWRVRFPGKRYRLNHGPEAAVVPASR